MTQIEFGVNNFRKYINLNPLRLGDITYLVGENNSGKSTFVKGLLLLLNNLANPSNALTIGAHAFDFNNTKNRRYGHLNLPTFYSALNRNSDDPEITFSCRLTHAQNNEFMDYTIETTVVSGYELNSSFGFIKKMQIIDNVNCRIYTYILNEQSKISCRYKIENFAPAETYINNLRQIQSAVNLKLDKHSDKCNYLKERYIDEYSQTAEVIEKEKKSLQCLSQGLDNAIKILTGECCPTFKNSYKTEYQTLPAQIFAEISSPGNEVDISNDLTGIDLNKEISNLAHNLDACIKPYSSIEYLYAHEAEQRFFYNINDHNDETAQMIKEYAEIFGGAWDEIYDEIVGSWLSHFDLTDKYIITEATEEGAFKVFLSKERPEWDIKNKCYTNRQQWRPLATYGTGIIRIVSLVMNLANLAFRYVIGNTDDIIPTTIVIEEPEMNLHPKYQSRLADLFRELNERYGFKFIIETHSEYIIRKTQVAVKQARYQSNEAMNALNPYKVLYFPQDGDPYEMQYRTDGRFSNSFGPGFYDEANNLIFEVL